MSSLKNWSVEKIVTYRDHREEVAAIVIHQQSGQTLNTSGVVTFEGDLGGQCLRGWCFPGNSNNKCSLLISVKTYVFKDTQNSSQLQKDGTCDMS